MDTDSPLAASPTPQNVVVFSGFGLFFVVALFVGLYVLQRQQVEQLRMLDVPRQEIRTPASF